MSTEDGTERTAVKTYVPAYQKSAWEEHAAELDMSQSEFVRTMVQAGRRDFELNAAEEEDSAGNPRGEPLEDRVLDILDREGVMDWDDLQSELTASIEDRLDETLNSLQNENRIRYDGRDGGYTITNQ